MVAALTAACAPGRRPCRRRPPRPHPHPGWRAHVPIVQPGWAACCRASLASPSRHPGPTYGHGARPPWCSASPMPCRAPALMATPSRWPGLPGKGAGGENYGSEPLGMGQILHSPLLFGVTGVPAAGSPRPCGRISSSGPHQPPIWDPEGAPSPGSALYPSRSRRDPGLGCPSCDPCLGCCSP